LPRKIGARGLALIKEFEGCRLTSYLCPANVWTVGFGSTGPHVKRGMTITDKEAENLLARDLDRFEAAVDKATHGKATDNQFDALVSFAFNVGIGAMQSSTLIRKHNAGDYAGAQAQFARWNKGGGKVLAGLTRRRAAEAKLYGSAV
jgi:lysozyme